MLTAAVRASSSEAPCALIQKNAQRVAATNATPTNNTRQNPKPVRIGLSTARGGRFMTSSSCGSNEITSASATEVTMLTQRTCGAVIGIVKWNKIATMMTSPWDTLVGSMKRMAFSILL